MIFREDLTFSLIILTFTILNPCRTKNAGKIPTEQNLEKVNKFYDKLYVQLKSKDYGLALFGQQCDPIPPADLDNFLDLAHDIIQDQEKDKAYRRSVKEHLRQKIRHFFDRSKVFCDFQKLLICDDKHRTCACPHSSMGVGRNGTCQVNIGKRCDFTEERLTNLGILIIEGEAQNVTCIGQAECVTSFGAATKICRCRAGYWGSSCKPSSYDNPSGKSFGDDGLLGRSFWVPNKTEDQQEYFLYPEEIKEELVKIMNLREMFEPDEREKEAQELYIKMESDNDKEDMVILDVYIRRAAHLTFGEACTLKKQAILDNPPLSKENSMWVDPTPGEIKKWQSSLLKDGQPFCNYLNHFRCDHSTKVCKCKQGLSWEDDKCRVKVGQGCGSDYDSVFEYDPLKDRKQFSVPYSPGCVNGATCNSKPLFFLKQCWCDSGNTCDSITASEDPQPPPGMISDIDSKFSLNLGDKCNPNAHVVLLNPPDSDKSDVKLRTASLDKMLATPSLQFCNIEKYYNCSEITKKCECLDNMAEESGLCRVKNMDSCGENYVYGLDFYPEGSKMWKVEEVFGKQFLPQCIKNAKCGSDEMPGKCFCKNGKSGEMCNDPKSVFTTVLSPSKVIGYHKDFDINRVFYKLNYYTYKVEQAMTLKYNDKCDPSVGLMLNRIVKFFRDVGSSDENVAGSKTLHQYSKASKWGQYLLRTGVTELCNAFLGLQCHKTSEKCRCPKGSVYEDKVCRLNVAEECNEIPSASWIPICRSNSECQPALYNFKFACTCKDGFSGDICSLNGTETEKNGITGDKHEYLDCPADMDPTECETLQSTAKGNGSIADPNGRGGNATGKNSDENHFKEMQEMLNEIMDHRHLILDKKCEPQNEQLFTHLFPHLPNFDKTHYTHLPEGIRQTYSKLRWIYNSGFEFCNRRTFFVCNGKQKCECGENHGLIREGKDCRLMEYSFCGEIGLAFNKNLPILLCQTGTKCSKIDYGLHKCMPVLRSNERF